MMVFASYTSAGPESGFPTLTLPIGKDRNNMPIGTYFMALPFNEQVLIEIAYAIEQKMTFTIKPPIFEK
jgi:Asp-tRNA(Asn)/Glu-tRNA(Gln) amidotransferase A subunit family amidase